MEGSKILGGKEVSQLAKNIEKRTRGFGVAKAEKYAEDAKKRLAAWCKGRAK